MFNRISKKEFLEFNRALSILLLSKIGILDSLEMLACQTKHMKFRDIIKKIAFDIRAGKSLSKSFAKYPEIFSEIYVANLKVAEETGNISEVISEYVVYEEKFYNLKKKIAQAARYPVFVLIVSIAVVSFMLFFLIPTFQSLFASMKTEVPPVTQFLLTISTFTRDNIMILLIVIMISIPLLNYIFKSESIKRNIIDKMLLRFPVISSFYIKNLLARFSLSMSILLRSRVTLPEALKISRSVSRNNLFKEEITGIIKQIIKGETLSANIQKSSLFDFTFRKLLLAGEEGAELDKVFALISTHYTNEFDYRVENLTSIIEPVMILAVGSIVALILIAMYLPMFELINYLGV